MIEEYIKELFIKDTTDIYAKDEIMKKDNKIREKQTRDCTFVEKPNYPKTWVKTSYF